MKKSNILLSSLFFLCACEAQETHCITNLGVNIISMSDGAKITDIGYSCEDFNVVEREILSLLPNNKETNINWNRVRGYNVWLHVGGKFSMWWGQKVAGYTFCPTTEIQIGIFAPHVARSNYGHEIIHAAQGCLSVQPISNSDDYDHSNWTRDGFWSTINTVASWH